jgi:uncharacterized membrane protein
MRLGPLTEHQTDLLVRAGALAGAATVLGMAARRSSPGAWTSAAAVALPLTTRGVTGHWPMAATLAKALPVEIEHRLTVQRPVEEVFDAWRRLEDLPETLRHVEHVEVLDEGLSQWTASTPAGKVEWIAEIVHERRPHLLAWRSLADSDILHEGRLELSPWRGGRGTLLDLRMRIGGGRAGNGFRRRSARAAVAALMRPALALEVREDLRRFKNRLEAGEVPTTEGQPTGDRRMLELGNPF